MSRLLAPLGLRAHASEAARKVTWLELFFDLVFVAAVARVVEPLHEHYALDGVVRFGVLFALIWWAWTGHTVFATRFDGSDIVQRGLTLVQMFIVTAMAANAAEELDSRSSAGFVAAYAGLRLVLVLQYVRALHIREARPLIWRYITGHGAAAVLWLGSAFVPAPERYAVWALALVVDLGTPWLALRYGLKVPPEAAHLPERFGLFTLILLGEAVISVRHAMESHDDWSAVAAASAFLGMLLVFLVWWWYFHAAAAPSERHLRSRRDALRFQVWSYAHYPFYLGIVILGVGVGHAVTEAEHAALGAGVIGLMTSAAAVMMLSLAAIGASVARARPTGPVLATAAALAAATPLAALAIPPAPVIVLTGVVVLCASQALLANRVRPRRAAATDTAGAGDAASGEGRQPRTDMSGMRQTPTPSTS